GEQERAAVGVVGLRHGLQAAVLHEGEEVQKGVCGGGGGVAGAVAGEGATMHGRPQRHADNPCCPRSRRTRSGAGQGGTSPSCPHSSSSTSSIEVWLAYMVCWYPSVAFCMTILAHCNGNI
uniref:Uncharacterized protein n=1 Tax=Triticum urartu TaxID=4572 RepID=A0A8R7QR32_TRIUA